MIKQIGWALFAVLFSIICSYHLASAKEDTAQITLRKTAVPKKHLYTYIVKKGDILSAIVRNIPGITEEDISDNYRLIQELNPDIEDVNKLRTGQKLVLPGRPFTEAGEARPRISTIDTESTARTALPAESRTYLIQKGDTLIKIITRELKDITDIEGTLMLMKSINPHIVDVNKIYAGDMIKLPAKDFSVRAAKKTDIIEKEEKIIEESIDHPGKIMEAKEKISMPPEARLAVIKHVITQMNGTITSTGNYYLPIPKTGQITIDCSKMPVIEFDDNTTIFLDLENRAPDNLKKIISDNWTNFFLVRVDKKDDVIAVLRKVFASSRNYGMTKQSRPMTVGNLLSAEFFVDWIIAKNDTKQAQPLTQGLRILYDDNLLFPKALKNYARKNGVIITEISAQTGISGKPEEIYSLPPLPVYPTASAKDFSHALLSDLGLSADKDVDIKIFDTEKDGINLSLKADVVVKDAGKKYVIYSRELSPQFVNVLTQAGNELIFLNDNESPKNIMETILRNLNIPFVSGYFTFSGLDKKQAPYTLSFSGTKIKTNKDLYVIDFDIDHELRGLLQEAWSANIAKY